jgi:hypothetical protein
VSLVSLVAVSGSPARAAAKTTTPASASATATSKVAAKSGASTTAAPVQRGTKDLRADIERRIVEVQRQAAGGLSVGKASCPESLAGVKKTVPIGTYTCTVAIEGIPAPYTVVVKEGGFLKGGVFSIAPARAIIDVGRVVTFLKEALDPAEASTAKVACGRAKVLVVDPGATFACTVVVAGRTDTYVMEVRNVNGLVSLKTGPGVRASSTAPASGPSTTVA